MIEPFGIQNVDYYRERAISICFPLVHTPKQSRAWCASFSHSLFIKSSNRFGFFGINAKAEAGARKKKDAQRTIHARIETWKPLWIVNIPNLQLKTSKKNANAPRKLNIYFIYTYSGAFINVFFLFLFLSFFVQTKTKIKCETWQFYSKVSMYFSIQLSRQMC